MVWYIRFLKSPKLDQKGHVRALITITTDLGEGFCPTDLTLYASVIADENEDDWTSGWQTVKWKSGMRTAGIDIAHVYDAPPVPLRLVVSSRPSREGDRIALEDVPEILGVWSDTLDRQRSQAGCMIERRYRTDSGSERAILEETGDSIARHIW